MTVCQVGGSGGHDAFHLADRFEKLNIVVQDLPEVQSAFRKHLSAALKDRVTFLAHDFFRPQPMKADVFLIKLILHDWPDQECVRILRGLVPAMRQGTRVFFLDYVGRQEPKCDEPQMPRSIQQIDGSPHDGSFQRGRASCRGLENYFQVC